MRGVVTYRALRAVLSAAALGTVLGLTITGCGADGRAGDAVGGTSGEATAQSGRAPSRTAAALPGEQMDIHITIKDQRFQATIFDSAAGRDLVAQLPLTVDMVDHGAVEKTGPLPSPLSLDGQPDGADPDVGDIGYYAPGNDLVLYYGDQSYHSGIVIIGRLDGDAAGSIADMAGGITATVEKRAV
jgi:hypothetical protein